MSQVRDDQIVIMLVHLTHRYYHSFINLLYHQLKAKVR